MKIELHYNSHISITLEPEGIIEETILAEMVARADRGVAVKLNKTETGMEVKVEK